MNEKKEQIWSSVITLLISMSIALLVIFSPNFVVHNFIPGEADKDAAPEDTIVLGSDGEEEFVKLGDMAEPTDNLTPDQAASNNQELTETQEPATAGEDLADAGVKAPAAPTKITSTNPSPEKVNVSNRPVNQKTGTKSDNAKPSNKPANQASSGTSQSNASAINSKMNKAFGGSGSGSTQGTPNGNSNVGGFGHATLGSGLVGYTVAKWGRPHSQYAGSVTVQVHVSNRGVVTQAKAISGKGEAWASTDVRRYCERESLKSAFSVPKNRTTEGIGTITWTFK